MNDTTKILLRAVLIGAALLLITFALYQVYDFVSDPSRSDYHIAQIDYGVVLEPDGTAAVTETRTFEFNRGSYTFAWFDLSRDAQNIVVLEDGRAYEEVDAAQASQRPPETFSVSESGSMYRVEWYYRAEAPATRYFQIRYDIPQAAVAYSDAVVYYQQYLSSANTTDIGKVTASVKLPAAADAENTLIWGRGPGHGTLYFAEDDPHRVDLKIERPGIRQHVEARFLMPADSLAAPARVESYAIYDEVYEEEQAAAAAAQRELVLARIALALAILIVLILLILPVFMRLRHKETFSRFEPAQKPPFYRDLPANVPPVIAAKLDGFYKTAPKTAELISHAILDLIYRRVLIAQTQGEGRRQETWLQLTESAQQNADVLAYEKPILDFLFRDVAQGQNAVTLKQVQRYSKRKKNIGSIRSLMSQVESHVERLWDAYDYEEHEKNKLPKLVWFSRLASFVIGGLGLLFVFGFVNYPLGAAGIVMAFGGTLAFLYNLILCHKKKMLTQKGEDELALWQALKRFFEEFSTFDEKELPEIGFWEKLLVYAAALGVADKVMRQLQLRYAQLKDPNYLYGHYYFMYGFSRMGPDMSSGFTQFQSSLTSAMRDAQTAVTRHNTSSGGGGGFSGGGGGGAGGSTGGGAG